MKLTTAILFGLVVCLAAANGKKTIYRSAEYDTSYKHYTTKPPQEEGGPLEEHPGPVEEQPGPIEEQPGPEEEQPGPEEEQPGPEEEQPGPVEEKPGPVEEYPGPEGGEEAGGEVEPPKEHPVDMMAGDTDAEKHRGYCHWEIGVWMKPGVSRRCGCMKCDCQKGGTWDCKYHFAYCPYYYCGNLIYNPATQICCCGKVHDKRASHACCGYYYYDKRHNKCCNYYSVRPSKSHCPRYQV